MIETRLLKQFIAVAEELNFNRAAERLNISQPPLSQAIQKLELKLGFALFVRSSRRVELTPAGEAFLKRARLIVRQLEESVHHARRISQGLSGRLCVSSISVAGYKNLLAPLKAYRDRYPDVEIEIRETPSALQYERLLSGQADVGFIRNLRNVSDDMVLKDFCEEKILIALPETDELARQDRIDVKDLSDRKFIMPPRSLGTGYHDKLVSLCEKAGFRPTICQECIQMHAAVGLVSYGFGIAFVPDSIAQSVKAAGVAFRELGGEAESEATMKLWMIYHRKNNNPALHNFLQALEAPYRGE